MKKYIYYSGKIVDSGKHGLPFNDIGVIRGVAVFDYFRTYNGKPFRLADYYARFKNSANKISLRVPISQKELSNITAQLLKKNKMSDCAFRLVLTGGPSSDNFSIQKNENFYILVEDLPTMPKKFYQHGASLITSEYQRHFPDTKTNFYIHAITAQPQKVKAKAQEILYYHQDKILECSKSNIFLVKDGRLITPKTGILPGITRLSVMDIAESEGIPCRERDIHLNELWRADEAFITSSGNVRVLPITKIDQKQIGNGKVGPISQLVMNLFDEMTNQ